MTQEPRRKPSPYKRTPIRSERNRPVLISKEQIVDEQTVAETTPETANTSIDEISSESVAETPIAKPARRKLPNFFSTVGTSEQSQEESAKEIRDARISRATKGKKITPSESEEEKKSTAPAPRPRQVSNTTRPNTFKMRYIFGMVIYLLVAQVAGIYVTQYLKSSGLDQVLTTLNLFGGKLVISTSTIIFLVILVGLLFILARFDMIPRSFVSASGGSRGKTTTTSRSEPGERVIPPTIRPGIKGDHDSLYEDYRKRQRRERKH
jgi:hypothetical protein